MNRDIKLRDLAQQNTSNSKVFMNFPISNCSNYKVALMQLIETQVPHKPLQKHLISSPHPRILSKAHKHFQFRSFEISRVLCNKLTHSVLSTISRKVNVKIIKTAIGGTWNNFSFAKMQDQTNFTIESQEEKEKSTVSHRISFIMLDERQKSI